MEENVLKNVTQMVEFIQVAIALMLSHILIFSTYVHFARHTIVTAAAAAAVTMECDKM